MRKRAGVFLKNRAVIKLALMSLLIFCQLHSAHADDSRIIIPVTYSTSSVLPITEGGTGATSFTPHAILIGNGFTPVGTLSTSSLVNGVMMSGGTGAAPGFKILTADFPLSYDSSTGVLSLDFLGVAFGGTGLSSFASNALLSGQATVSPLALPYGAANTVWASSPTSPFGPTPMTISVQSPLLLNASTAGFAFSIATVPVASGGTGNTTYVDGGVIVGQSNGSLGSTAVGTAGQVLVSGAPGTAPSFQSLSAISPLSYSTSGASLSLDQLPLSLGGTGASFLSQNGVLYALGSSIQSLTPGTSGTFLASTGTSTAPTYQSLGGTGVIQFSTSTKKFSLSTFQVSDGGTGKTSSTLYSVLFGNDTSPLLESNVGSSGQILMVSTSGKPTFQTLGPSSGPIYYDSANKIVKTSLGTNVTGGTGQVTLPLNELLIGGGSVGTGASGDVLINQSAAAPVFQSMTATSPLSYNSSTATLTLGALAVSAGGTGVTTLTSNGLLLGQGTNPVTALTTFRDSGQVLTSKGAGVVPSFQNLPGTWEKIDQSGNPACVIDSTRLNAFYLIPGGSTCTLPVPTTAGFQLVIQVASNTGGSDVAINGAGKLINFSSTKNLHALKDWVWLFFEGTNWTVVSQSITQN